MRWLTLALALALSATGAMAKKPKKGPTAEEQVRSALNARADAISLCAVKALSGDVKQVDVAAKVMINNLGQVVAVDVTVTPEAGATRTCVEEAIRAAV